MKTPVLSMLAILCAPRARTIPMLTFAMSMGCSYMRTPYAIQQLNGTNQPSTQAHPVPLADRVARLTRQHLADAYVDPSTVGRWLSLVESHPEPLTHLATCLYEQQNVGDPNECYAEFMESVAPIPKFAHGKLELGQSVWNLPPPPLNPISVPAVPSAPSSTNSAASPASASIALSAPAISLSGLMDRGAAQTLQELDVERFLGNIRGVGSSLVALSNVVGKPIDEAVLTRGVKLGLAEARAYITGRPWHRHVSRPTTAIVMSGGGANGAFTAGYIWRLFEVLSRCHDKDGPDGCKGATIDLVVGTSTGSLIGVLVDMYSTPGLEKRAVDLLVDNYTCTVESDLYCVHDTWDWKLFEDTRGLVRFDGIRGKLEQNMLPEMLRNQTELVAVSVDYESGDVYAISDQDPADAAPQEGRIDGVLASIVEPVLAEPVDGLRRAQGKVSGTFVDGGIRSGLPVMQAVDRGAERVLIISTSSIEADPVPPPKHALTMLNRSVDLMVQQPRVAEVEQGEFAAVARRLAEYNVCMDRLRLVTEMGSAGDKSEVNQFCERHSGFGVEHPTLKGAVSTWIGPQLFPQVAQSWKTQWVFRPEEQLSTAAGYAFSPQVMRPLFEQGVRTFQARCAETLRLLEIGGNIAALACAEPLDSVLERVKRQYQPVERCTANKEAMRVCK